ncbi:staphylopine uptake ABC transporter ATP-binding protein CntD [Paenibacillus favisporus]
MNMLEVNHLKVWDSRTHHPIIHGSSFQVESGKCLAIIGESGSGKSVTCRSVIRLNSPSLASSGDIFFQGENLTDLSDQDMRKRRGKQIGMIVQNGMRAFDPSCVVGVHFKETLKTHYGWSKSETERNMSRAMEKVALRNPLDLMNRYPFQLSGGMLQRMMIALTLVLEPDLIIADEPTTALDTITQFEVVEQLRLLRERLDCSMLFISHDLGVVKKIADDVLVMNQGKIVERGAVQAVFEHPSHPHTQFLVSTRMELASHFKQIMEEDDAPC